MHNVATGKNAVKGCYLAYQKKGENHIRRMKISDEKVRNMEDYQIIDERFINQLVSELNNS